MRRAKASAAPSESSTISTVGIRRSSDPIIQPRRPRPHPLGEVSGRSAIAPTAIMPVGRRNPRHQGTHVARYYANITLDGPDAAEVATYLTSRRIVAFV